MEGLNHEQMQAIKDVNGPVIVFAGAGSGKTRTLTYRVAYMITEHNISPFNILAITFTNKATNEMKERLQKFLDIDTKHLTICTFHALCAMVLRREITALGYKQDFSIVDEEDQLKVICEVIKDLKVDKKNAKSYQKKINYDKCFMTIPDDASDPNLKKVYLEYQKRMFEQNLLDFEDLLIKAYELFEKNPEILFKYQQKFKYILVDEFQDTNVIQYKIVKLLALEHHNLFVVGDDDQSIYSFRGTNYENINLFKEDFPEYRLYTLCHNYRSTSQIIEIANRLIANNKNREPKEMTTDITGDTDDVTIYTASSEKEEVDFVINRIRALKKSSDSYSDFAVLYRSSVLLRNVELGFIRNNIPYKVFGGISYLRRKEIKDVIAYLKLMLNYDDVNSFKRVVNVPSRGIGDVTVETILKVRKANKCNVIEAIKLSESILSPKRYQALKGFYDIIVGYDKLIDEDNLVNVFEKLISEIAYEEYLKETYDEKDANERIANINEFKSILYTIDSSGLGSKRNLLLEAFDEAILSDSFLQSQDENWGGVTLSTIHSVKGLEFKYVFIIGMENNIFPNHNRLLGNEELEEERRICYVAITRAKEKVFLTHCETRLLYGSFFHNRPSDFINEAFGIDTRKEVINSDDIINDATPRNKTKMIPSESKIVAVTSDTYNVGDTIIHSKFGEGIIISIKNDIGNIFFKDDKSSKSILLNHPSIRKK